VSNTQRGGKCPVTPLTTLADIRGAMYSMRMKLYDCRTVKAFAQGTFISFVANALNRTAVANAFFIQWGCSHRCLPSVLRRCWLGGRKGIRPVKTEWWGAGVVICLERGADLHIAQLMPLPLTVSCFSKIQIGFTFLVPAHPGSPEKRAVKCVCVRVCVCESVCSHRISRTRVRAP